MKGRPRIDIRSVAKSLELFDLYFELQDSRCYFFGCPASVPFHTQRTGATICSIDLPVALSIAQMLIQRNT